MGLLTSNPWSGCGCLLHSSEEIGKAINKLSLLLAHLLDKTGIIEGVEIDLTYVTQCGTNTVNVKDESQWKQPQFSLSFALFTFHNWQSCSRVNS